MIKMVILLVFGVLTLAVVFMTMVIGLACFMNGYDFMRNNDERRKTTNSGRNT